MARCVTGQLPCAHAGRAWIAVHRLALHSFLELHSRAAPRCKDHTSNGDWEWEIQETKGIPKSIPYAYEQPCFKNSWRPTAQDWPEQLQRPTAPSEPNPTTPREGTVATGACGRMLSVSKLFAYPCHTVHDRRSFTTAFEKRFAVVCSSPTSNRACGHFTKLTRQWPAVAKPFHAWLAATCSGPPVASKVCFIF